MVIENKLTFDKDTHEYFLDGKYLYGVTDILQKTGLIDFSSVRLDVLESARKFGIAFHKTTELWDKGILNVDILSLPLIPLLEGWKKFKTDYKIEVFDEIEKQVYSKKWNFAGTLDRIFKRGNNIILIDIKTSTNILPVVGLQLAAYQIAYEEMMKVRIKERWGITFDINGKYSIYPFKNLSDKGIFLSALNVYNWKRRFVDKSSNKQYTIRQR